MKVRDRVLKVDVEVRVKECQTFACYWPRQNPGVFVQGRGYSNPTKDYLCGNREIRGCPEVCEPRKTPNVGGKMTLPIDNEQHRRDGSALSGGLGLLPELEEQADSISFCGERFDADERGHWYSPRRVRELLCIEREQWKKAREIVIGTNRYSIRFTADGSTEVVFVGPNDQA